MTAHSPPRNLATSEGEMSARRIVDEADARACLAAMATTGEALRLWARRHGVDGRSLHAWQLNLSGLRRSSRTRAPVKLVELVPAPATPSSRHYTLRVGEVSIEVGDDFDAETLRRLLGIVRAC
jgi:hypothetical protein